MPVKKTKQKNFRLPLDLCKLLEEDGRPQAEIVESALRAELGSPVKEDWRSVSALGSKDITERVRELARTLPPATAQRIAELEAS